MPDQRVVIITGASEGGLGHALALAFAKAGCRVYATARTLSSISSLAQHCELLELDVANPESREAAIQAVLDVSGRIDVLINNAGQAGKGFTLDMPLDAFQQLMQVNFLSVVAMCKLVAPHMAQRKSGTIVNIGSSVGYVFLPQAAAYSASKAAVRSFTDALRVELAPFGIRVVHAALGFVRTRLFGNMAPRIHEQPDSPYQQFEGARQQLWRSDVQAGWGSLAPSDPAAVASRLAKMALRPGRLPRCWIDGWMGWPLYLLGCYAPLWLLDLLHSSRLFGSNPFRI